MIQVETFDGYRCIKCREYSVIRTIRVEYIISFNRISYSMKVRTIKTICMNCFSVAIDNSLLATKEMMSLNGTETIYDKGFPYFAGLEGRKRQVACENEFI